MLIFFQEGFLIFGLEIRYYSVLLVLGAFSGIFLAGNEARRRNFDPMHLWEILPWALVVGLIGARIWHVLTPTASMLINGKNPYFLYPERIFNLRTGGLGLPGALIAGALVVYGYTRRRHMKFTDFSDISMAGVALMQAIGRWGNYINQELYGLPTRFTHFPFAIYIDPAHRFPNYQQQAYYLPLFFYEFLWNLINMGLLLWLPRHFKQRWYSGDTTLTYFLVYSFGRFFLEFIRLDYSPLAGFNVNQLVMAIVFLVSLSVLIVRHTSRQINQIESSKLK